MSRLVTVRFKCFRIADGRTRFECYAVVPIGDVGICDENSITAINIPAIGVGGSMRGVRDRVDSDIPISHVLALVNLEET